MPSRLLLFPVLLVAACHPGYGQDEESPEILTVQIPDLGATIRRVSANPVAIPLGRALTAHGAILGALDNAIQETVGAPSSELFDDLSWLKFNVAMPGNSSGEVTPPIFSARVRSPKFAENITRVLGSRFPETREIGGTTLAFAEPKTGSVLALFDDRLLISNDAASFADDSVPAPEGVDIWLRMNVGNVLESAEVVERGEGMTALPEHLPLYLVLETTVGEEEIADLARFNRQLSFLQPIDRESLTSLPPSFDWFAATRIDGVALSRFFGDLSGTTAPEWTAWIEGDCLAWSAPGAPFQSYSVIVSIAEDHEEELVSLLEEAGISAPDLTGGALLEPDGWPFNLGVRNLADGRWLFSTSLSACREWEPASNRDTFPDFAADILADVDQEPLYLSGGRSGIPLALPLRMGFLSLFMSEEQKAILAKAESLVAGLRSTAHPGRSPHGRTA